MGRKLLFRSASAIVVLLISLTGCGSIPSDGNVNHYADPAQSATENTGQLVAEGPAENASPEEVVRGFIEAGVGATDDYTVAREFLTPSLADSWQPDEKTLVHDAPISINHKNQGQTYSVNVPVSTSIDNRGLATSYDTAENQELDIKLEEVEGQWRISSAPNTTVLALSSFNQVFAPFTLYFYDPTFTYAVPDIRWFADRSTVATSLVRVLLQGPAPYLKGAVSTAVPTDTVLNRNSVPVNGGTAAVDVSTDQSASSLSNLDTEHFKTQLTQTLSQLNGIQAVQLSVEDQPMNDSGLEKYVAPEVNPEVDQQVIGFSGKDLVLSNDILSDDEQTTIYTSNETMQSPAMGYKRQNFAFLNAERNSLSWVNANTRSTGITGEGLTQPSFDQYQWLWSSTENAEVKAVATGSSESDQNIDIQADWLKGYSVKSLRISRDGTRAAIVTQSGESTAVWIAGIRRNSENKPKGLLQPVRIASSGQVSDAHWYSDSSLLLANYDDGSAHIAYLSGETKEIEPLEGLVDVTAASGNDTALAHTKDSSVYTLLDGRWSRLDVSLQDANFSG